MARRKGFMMYFELRGIIAKLSGEQVKRLLLEMFAYAEAGQAPDHRDDPSLDLIWDLCQARLDADAERYDQTVQRRKEAVNKRWDQVQAEKKGDDTQPCRSKYRTGQPTAPAPDKMDKYLDF